MVGKRVDASRWIAFDAQLVVEHRMNGADVLIEQWQSAFCRILEVSCGDFGLFVEVSDTPYYAKLTQNLTETPR